MSTSSSSSSSSSSHPLDPAPPPPASRDAARVDSPLHTTITINPSPPTEQDDGQGQGLQHLPPSRPRQPSYETETRGYSVNSFTSSSSTTTTTGGARPSSSSSTMSSDAATITPMLPHHHLSSSPSVNLPRRGSSGSASAQEQEGEEELDTNGPGRGDSRLRWEDSWSEDEESADEASDSPLNSPTSSTITETPQARRERRRRERRIFGGASSGHRHGSRGQELEEEENEEGGERGGGDKGVGEVAGLVLGGSLSPMPLLLPLACARLGPGLFVPLLVLAGALGWLSAVVIGAEGRYVGARSFPALASAVFPHRLKLHLLGESLAVLFVLGGSIVRSTLDVVAAAEVAVDLFVPERRRRDWEREVGVGVICAVWLLLPLLLPPLLRLLSLDALFSSLTGRSSTSPSSSPPTRYSRLASTSSPDLSSSSPYPSYSSGPSSPPPRARWTALLRLPAWSVALITWPLALLILGVRLKRLNRDASHSTPSLTLSVSSSSSSFSSLEDLSKLPSHLFPNPTDPLTNQTLWPAILLPFSALLGAAHETFFYFTSLARPSSTATARRRGGGGGGGRQMSSSGELPGEGTATTGSAGRRDEGKRNQYPLALAIGLFGSFLIHLGWALVGALGPRPSVSAGEGEEEQGATWPLPAANFLSDPRLPRGDFWINLSRLLCLVGILSQLQGHARLGVGRGRRALAFFVRPKGGANARAGVKGWRSVVARVGVWGLVGGLGVLVVSIPRIAGGGAGEGGGGGTGGGEGEVGGHGSGLVYAVQWWAVVGGGLGACLGPALAYLTLFHLRPPRQIFLSPSTTNLSSTTGATTTTGTSPSRSPSSASAQIDALLLRKERSIQRKLSGRRVWTDVGVFGALGPVGVVLVGRGVWALVSG